ncbi:hypothetical protein FOL47_007377 [Perkinsus chesapeaki]|uniref:Uncharacterized protein n=1 Tax=Perkinsus chesapeaki TaxID=330153 RepID=A0A7J6LKZ6_PERCH|nr:hypothetical protein FOL47_007377 [Perkinsus chesapeaki]
MKLNLYIGVALLYPAIGKILYRDYKKGDRFFYPLCQTVCGYKEGIPCYVAIDDKIKAIVGCMTMEIPYTFTPDEEKAIRRKMSGRTTLAMVANVNKKSEGAVALYEELKFTGVMRKIGVKGLNL